MSAPDPGDTSPWDIVVEMRGVWKIYKQRQRSPHLRDFFKNFINPPTRTVEALRGIDLTVRRGEIVAYAGPNGAGKSTTIKLLSSLLTPDRGTVRVLGIDPVRDRVGYVGRIGVVFGQRTELWWDHPIEASFEWKRVVWNIPRTTYDRMFATVRDLLDIEPFLKTSARELSLGQRMRADLAMALLHEPEILFLDEPTLGLDVLAKRNMLNFVKELNRTRGLTVMVTSHDMSDLEQLAGRIVMVHNGAIAFDGAFDRLRSSMNDRRRLLVQTDSETAPILASAELISSQADRHEYIYDARTVSIADLLAEASTQARIVDVETHRADIDDVIADLYQTWLGIAKDASERAPVAS